MSSASGRAGGHGTVRAARCSCRHSQQPPPAAGSAVIAPPQPPAVAEAISSGVPVTPQVRGEIAVGGGVGGAVDDQVAGGQPGQLPAVVVAQVAQPACEVEVRVDVDEGQRDGQRLGAAGVAERQQLPGAGGRVVQIAVDEVQSADAGAGQLEGDRAAEGADARPRSPWPRRGGRCRRAGGR